MSELTFEQMLEDSLKTIRNGEVVDGTVIDVKPDQIILNIGYKADGILMRNEYTNDPNLDLTTVVSVGDPMTVKVLKVNDGEGQVLLTYKRLAQEKGTERLKEAYENQEVLKAPVAQILGGGLSVNVDGVRVFIPASLVSDEYEKDLNKYQDQEIEFVIKEFNPKRNRIIGDRRQLMAKEKEERKKELFDTLQVGDVVEGTVKNVTNFGAFIDLGGVDGLLHISEMSWGRVENPKNEFKVGDKVKVMIKDIKGNKIALSRKFPETNPWVNAAEDFAVGTIIEGKVARMTDFGAFVELAPGVDALLHVSQISRAHVAKPSDVLSVGQTITAKIVDLNEADKKISLSMKVLETPEEQKAIEEREEEIAREQAAADAAAEEEAEEAAEEIVEDAEEEAAAEAVEEAVEDEAVAEAVEEAVEDEAVAEAVEEAVEDEIAAEAVEEAVEDEIAAEAVEEAVEDDAAVEAVEEAVEDETAEEAAEDLVEDAAEEPKEE